MNLVIRNSKIGPYTHKESATWQRGEFLQEGGMHSGFLVKKVITLDIGIPI
ncbi:MAG: hypothetical protein DID90_2727553390, partial [Candidatus Nitrotoga sp. LAW]